MNILALDMEYNQPSKSIIQIGVAICDLDTGELLNTACYNIRVKEIISEYIKTLTGIKQEDVNNGVSLEEAYTEIQALHCLYQCFRNPLTWGGGDSDELRKALDLDVNTYIFGRRWIDAKTLFISRAFSKNEKHQAGLAKALTKLGMKFEGSKHNARDDAINTFRIYHRLLEDFKEVV